MKNLIKVFCLFLPLALFAADENVAYTSLRSSMQVASSSVEENEIITISITSEVKKSSEVPQKLIEKLNDAYKGLTEKAPAISASYLYSYAIRNNGSRAIIISFTNQDVVNSPFTDIIQGYQITIPAQSTYSISYRTLWEPKEELSNTNISLQNSQTKKFEHSAMSSFNIYIPSKRFSPYLLEERQITKAKF